MALLPRPSRNISFIARIATAQFELPPPRPEPGGIRFTRSTSSPPEKPQWSFRRWNAPAIRLPLSVGISSRLHRILTLSRFRMDLFWGCPAMLLETGSDPNSVHGQKLVLGSTRFTDHGLLKSKARHEVQVFHDPKPSPLVVVVFENGRVMLGFPNRRDLRRYKEFFSQSG